MLSIKENRNTYGIEDGLFKSLSELDLLIKEIEKLRSASLEEMKLEQKREKLPTTY